MTHQVSIPTTQTATGTGKSRLVQVLLGSALTLSALLVVARFVDSGLPGCSSMRAGSALKAILRHNSLGGAAISETRELANEASEIRCAAVITATDGTKHDLTYRIYKSERGRTRISANWHRQ